MLHDKVVPQLPMTYEKVEQERADALLEVGLQTSYLGEPFGNPTLAYLIPHVEKALVSLSKKYESAAVREFERNNNGIYSTKSKSSSLVTSDDDHHPKDAFATYMLRHKHDRMLPQISALKKL